MFILLCLTPADFTRQRRASEWESVNWVYICPTLFLNWAYIFPSLLLYSFPSKPSFKDQPFTIIENIDHIFSSNPNPFKSSPSLNFPLSLAVSIAWCVHVNWKRTFLSLHLCLLNSFVVFFEEFLINCKCMREKWSCMWNLRRNKTPKISFFQTTSCFSHWPLPIVELYVWFANWFCGTKISISVPNFKWIWIAFMTSRKN